MPSRKQGFAGKPYPHVEVALRDPESGRLLEGAGEGELVVRGPNVFAGYWANDEATRAAFADGWLLTGDWAERDEEGYYRIADRLKDMYISGGENVYPAEVEAVLFAHAAVLDAAVVGIARRAVGRERGRVRRPRGGSRDHGAGAGRALPRLAREVQGAEARPRRPRAAPVRDEQGAQGGAEGDARGTGMTELAAPLPTGVSGRVLTKRGAETRARLLEAAE